MTETVNYIEIAARQAIPIPSRLAVQLSKLHSVDDLHDFIDDVASAEASAEILLDTELHNAAARRLERLGFGPADYRQSKKIMLGVLFSPEVSQELGCVVEAQAARVHAA